MKNYNPTNPSKHIKYLDQNNLYGWAMSRYLPYGGFKSLKNVNNFDVNSIGYILEADLEYPDELDALYNDYPLAPEKFLICCQIILRKLQTNCIKVADVKKIIPNLGNKTNYLLHYRNLQFSLPLGMKLTKIHKVLKFKESG